MHVLFVPSTYPTADEPWRGTGVRDQALALARSGVKVGVAFVERRGLGKLNLATLVASHFQTVSRDDDGVTTLRTKGWSSIACARLTRRLVRSYIEIHGRPDLIHVHGVDRVASDLAIPYVVTEQPFPVVDIAYFHLPPRKRSTLPFTFLPRHLTVVSGLTIGVPAFFLALGPNSQRWRPGFVNRVLRDWPLCRLRWLPRPRRCPSAACT